MLVADRFPTKKEEFESAYNNVAGHYYEKEESPMG